MLNAVELQLHLLCILILLMLIGFLKISGRTANRQTLMAFLATCCAYCAFHGFASLVDGQPDEQIWNHVSHGLCYFSAVLTAFGWMRYVDVESGCEKAGLTRRLLEGIPLIVMALAVLAMPFFGGVARMDSFCRYQRGPLYFLLPVCMGFYLFGALVRAVLCFKGAGASLDRCKAVGLMTGGSLLILMTAAQILWSGLCLYGIALIVVAMMVVFIAFHSETREDASTGIRNRIALTDYAEARVREHQANGDHAIQLLLADMDRLNYINSRFGRAEGDRALKLVAQALSTVCQEKQLYCARYADDEFAVLAENLSPKEIKALASDLATAVATTVTGKSYWLTITVGTEELADHGRFSDMASKAQAKVDEQKKYQKANFFG